MACDQTSLQWATAVSPMSVDIQDPYLASIRFGSDLFEESQQCHSDEDAPCITPSLLNDNSSLWLLRRLLADLAAQCPRLSHVRVRLRLGLYRERGWRLDGPEIILDWAAQMQTELLAFHLQLQMAIG